MENKTIKVGISPLTPFVIKTRYRYDGFEIDLWEEIAQRLNIKFKYIKVPFNKLLNGVKNSIYDIAFSGITINKEREKKFNFCHSYLGSGLLILSKTNNQKKFLEKARNGFFNELIKITLFFIGLIFFISNVIWFFKKSAGLIDPGYFSGIIQTTQYIIYSISNSYFQDIIPHQTTGKIFIVLIILLSVITILYHIIKVGLFLTKKEENFDPQIIEELKNKKVATEYGSTSEKLLKSYKIKTKKCKKIETAFKKLKNNYIDAVVYDALPILHYIKENTNEFKISPKIDENQSYAIAIKQNSDLVGKIDNEILQMKEDGYFDFLYKKWFGDIKI